MDIKIKNGVIAVPDFEPAFQKIVAGIQMPARQCLEVATVLEEILKQKRIIERTRRIVLEKYGKKDSEGKLITNDRNETIFESPNSKMECMKEMEQLFEEDFTVTISKKIEVPESFKMFPQEFILLKDFIDLVEDKKS
jgi:hypothetical protein